MADLSTTCERLLRAEIDVLRSERDAANRWLYRVYPFLHWAVGEGISIYGGDPHEPDTMTIELGAYLGVQDIPDDDVKDHCVALENKGVPNV